MPGKFVDVVVIYKCGLRPDGTAIMCTRFEVDKAPFVLAASEELPGGWKLPGEEEVHIPLSSLITEMGKVGISVAYDPEQLSQRLAYRGPKEAP